MVVVRGVCLTGLVTGLLESSAAPQVPPDEKPQRCASHATDLCDAYHHKNVHSDTAETTISPHFCITLRTEPKAERPANAYAQAHVKRGVIGAARRCRCVSRRRRGRRNWAWWRCLARAGTRWIAGGGRTRRLRHEPDVFVVLRQAPSLHPPHGVESSCDRSCNVFVGLVSLLGRRGRESLRRITVARPEAHSAPHLRSPLAGLRARAGVCQCATCWVIRIRYL